MKTTRIKRAQKKIARRHPRRRARRSKRGSKSISRGGATRKRRRKMSYDSPSWSRIFRRYLARPWRSYYCLPWQAHLAFRRRLSVNTSGNLVLLKTPYGRPRRFPYEVESTWLKTANEMCRSHVLPRITSRTSHRYDVLKTARWLYLHAADLSSVMPTRDKEAGVFLQFARRVPRSAVYLRRVAKSHPTLWTNLLRSVRVNNRREGV